MNNKLLFRAIAGIVFIISAVQFFMTAQPSVSFWDCGEFIAAAFSLQVPHPPGAPFFLLIGRFFSMLPFADNIAFRVNTISVLSSAFSVLFLFLISVKTIENFKGKKYSNIFEALSTYMPAAIAALAFSFSDTFWFNGVEAEVYAASTVLFAGITYLMMLWNERADESDNEKYILMMAFLVGLSTGVHLMSVLAIVPVVMVILFRKYVQDEEACKRTGYIFIVHAAVCLLVALSMWVSQKADVPPTPEEFQSYDTKFKLTMAAISAIIMGAFYKKIFSRNSFYMPLIIGGIALVAVYPGVVKLLPELIKTIGGDVIFVDIMVIVAVFAVLGYLVYYSIRSGRATLHLAGMSLIFVILGFTTYAMVIIRANMQTPMNENEPDNFTELVSYLNREQYGDFPIYKRRFSSEPHQQAIYTEYTSDMDFFWRYQMDHMFNRYMFWNFIGRESWDQDAGVDWKQLMSYGAPFLIGLLGIFYHFRKDWKMASVFMIMFIFMGYLTAFYQNQQQPQPRERDYFYVGAYFVFGIWIALGIKGILDLVVEKIKNFSTARTVSYAVMVLTFIILPMNMASANYFTHDRSRNWVPWDYSYNLLQSCAPNAILFTNGDNDTFPLWYLQDVEGVRRDVRVANLSLINTPWYIKQLKNTEPYGAQKVTMSLTDEFIERIEPSMYEPQFVEVPVPQAVLQQYTAKDAHGLSFVDRYGMIDSSVAAGKLRWFMANTLQFGDTKALRAQDIVVRDIIVQNNWKRPIYFAVTCTDDSKIGLDDYFVMEGLAHRLVPIKRRPNVEFVNEAIMSEQLFKDKPGFSKTYRPGFKFRGFNDRSIFFDDNHARMVQNFRGSYIRLALYYMNGAKNHQMVIKALDEMERRFPTDIIPMDYRLKFDISGFYLMAGDMPKYIKMARELEKIALQKLKENPNDISSYYNPYRLLSEIYDNLKEYDKAIGLFMDLQRMYPDDPGIKNEIRRFQALALGKDSVAGK